MVSMPLQVTEKVRLTPMAVKDLIKSEQDQQFNLMPGDLAEIVEIGEKEHEVDLRCEGVADSLRLPGGGDHALLSQIKRGDRVEVFCKWRRRWQPAIVVKLVVMRLSEHGEAFRCVCHPLSNICSIRQISSKVLR